jgi:hypothetical protein
VAVLAFIVLAFLSASASAAAPKVDRTLISRVTTTAVILEADVNLGGKPVLYRFEYGLADCSIDPCAEVPGSEGEVKPEELLAGVEVARVKAPLGGLSPGMTYHFQVVVTNGPQTTESTDRAFITYLEPQEFGPCPNDNFRGPHNPAAARIEYSGAGLPDCRFYEQVSPVNKDAADVTGTVPYARAALGGGGITFLSSSGVPGGVGSQELPVYLASRGDEGPWSTKGLLPPGNTGQKALVLGWTPDFSAVFARAIKVGSPPNTAFLMTPSGQAPLKIVDYTPNLGPHFAGVSDGAAEVLFESKVALPGVGGALEGKSNLYVWDKASKEIGLAGILNDKSAPSSGAFAGSYDWVLGTTPSALTKGGAEREYYTQEQHAISTDGSTVYFTAADTGRLYLRENPTAKQSLTDVNGKCTQPELACTVQVSTSQKTNGAGPNGTDSAGPRPAAFMGASGDGSVSFFTSSEKLTDDANTGPEQKPAAIQRADIGGENVNQSCVPVHALGVAVDAAHIYWADPASSTIGRANLDCGEVEGAFIVVPDLEAEPGILVPGKPQYVAVDASHIYWTDLPEGEEINQFPPAEDGVIGRAAIDGNAESVEAEFISSTVTGEGLSAPQGIAVDAAHIYWANPQDGDKSIGRADIDGSNADLHFVKLGIGETPQGGVAVDASHIYWTTRSNGGGSFIVRCDLDGNREAEIFTGSGAGSDPQGVALDANHVYWVRRGGGTIARTGLDLGHPELEWITGVDHPRGLGVDTGHVYWSSNGETPPNPGNDLYRYAEGELDDVSIDSVAPAGAEVRGVLGGSQDGSRIYYAANGVPDGVTNSPNAKGEEAKAGTCPVSVSGGTGGTCNLYLWQEGPASKGTTSFIARLDVGGAEVQTDAANWVASTENIFPTSNFEKTARVSPDGRTLLFRSQRQLTAYESENVPELYRYRTGDAGVSCVSCNPTGAPPTGNTGFGDVFPSVVVPTNPSPSLSHNLSSDGARVFFETTDALVGVDTNGASGCSFVGSSLQSYPSCLDVYEWEAQGSGTCDAAHAVAQGGCLYLLSTGKGTEPALIADASADGKDAYFYTRSRLVGQDKDQLIDVYDIREGGGLAGQNQPPPNPCESESCKPAPTTPQAIESPPKFSGPGNPKTKAPPCKKPKHKVKGHCVAKHSKAKKHSRGKANPKGRAGR